MREQPGVEAFVGEEAGDPHGVEVRAVGRLEHQRHVRSAALRGDPVLDRRVMRLRLQKRVGALRHPHARERRLRLLDQRAVERHLPLPPVIHVEHGLEMLAKQRPPLRVRRARELAFLPVPREPGQDQIIVDLRRLASEHEVDLERLIDEGRIVDILLDLLLKGQDEPRPHQPFEGLPVQIVGRVLKTRALAEAEGLFERG